MCGFDVSPWFVIFDKGWRSILTEMELDVTLAVDAGEADEGLAERRHMEGVKSDCDGLHALVQ